MPIAAPPDRPEGRPRLILWDVDGTLLTAGPAAQTAFDEAVTRVTGRAPVAHGVHMSGKTDPQIALEILATMAIEEPRARQYLPAVLRSLEENLEAAIHQMQRDGRLLPGVEELVPRLHRTGGMTQSVLTGNLEPNARIKVALFGLDPYLDFDVGAYGSDDIDRDKLVPIARAKAEAKIGVTLPDGDVWVIGDTPRDLACARAGRARCLLVATGRIPIDELEQIGADAVLADLSDVDGAFNLLTR